MNDRIIQMAIEAGFNPVNCTGGNIPLFDKFAELLVEECAKVAREFTLRKCGLDSSYDGIVFVEEEIRDHFNFKDSTPLTPLPITEGSE